MNNELKEVNGYTNYPTFALCVWIDNEQYTSARVADEIESLIELTDLDPKDSATKFEIEAEFKEWIIDFMVPEYYDNSPARVMKDLLGFALDCVDWLQVTERYIENYIESLEYC